MFSMRMNQIHGTKIQMLIDHNGGQSYNSNVEEESTRILDPINLLQEKEPAFRCHIVKEAFKLLFHMAELKTNHAHKEE